MYQTGSVVADAQEKQVFASQAFKRVESLSGDSTSQLVDTHPARGVRIHYFRVHSGDPGKPVKFPIVGTITGIVKTSEFGVVLQLNRKNRQYAMWLPGTTGVFRFDENERLAETRASDKLDAWRIYPDVQLSLVEIVRKGETGIIPYVTIEDPKGEFYSELQQSGEIERRLYRKSEWFFASRPADVWNYLINGSVYDPRSCRGVDKRFKCQQCAYAWWSYFGFLHRSTHKTIYDILQDELAYSVLVEMHTKRQFGHGYWSDQMETHARFHLDGVHLLISQYEKTAIRLWLDAAEESMSFVGEQLTEKLDDGSIWFLHDTVEGSRRHHFKSGICGKSPDNSLCVNTHIQALTVLFRLSQCSSNKQLYGELLESGLRSLRRVLEFTDGESLYRLLMVVLMNHRETRHAASKLGKLKSAFLQWALPRSYWAVRRNYPRIVFPNGFIERDLSLTFFSDSYHILNVKDLLTLYRQTQLPWLRSYIQSGVGFAREYVRRVGLVNALTASPFYIELVDVLHLYGKLVGEVPPEEMKAIEEGIYQASGGYSLDFYASEFVQ